MAEIHYIDEYNTFKNGYNSTTGGDGGFVFSAETLKKIGDKSKEWHKYNDNPFKGQHHSDETKKLISEKNRVWAENNIIPFKGKIHSIETRTLISQKVKEYYKYHNSKSIGRLHSNAAKQIMREKRIEWHKYNDNPFKGQHHSDETKQIISQKCIGRDSPNKGKSLSESHKNNLSCSQSKWLAENPHPFLGGHQSDNAREKMRNAWKDREIVTCPYCGKSGINNMKRYHFDNCKQKLKE